MVVKPHPNLYQLAAFDPGSGATGWAHFVVDTHAFTRPENLVVHNIVEWDCGEFTGTEYHQLEQIGELLHKLSGTVFQNTHDVVSEDFELMRMVRGEAGRNLLSPVRINAVIAYMCASSGRPFHLQARQMRKSITAERLRMFGFSGRWVTCGRGKDAFAAMQHGIVWLRRTKQQSRKHPWKLSDNISSNAVWDCSCARGKRRCDLKHP